MTRLLFIADPSSSATPYWAQTTQAVAQALEIFRHDACLDVYLLGTDIMIAAEEWRSDLPMPPSATGAGSFLGPVFKTLYRQPDRPDVIVLFGSGQVFDLPDWAALESNARWVLVQTGPESLQTVDQRLIEINSAQLPGLVNELHQASRSFQPGARSSSLSGFIKHNWTVDFAGFPMIWIEALFAYWSFFPTTKVQFECYLSEARPKGYDDAWYADYLANYTSRLSPCAADLTAFEGILATALLPAEIEQYLTWQGAGYRLPQVAEWRAAWGWLASQEVSVLPAEIDRRLAPSARCMWEALLRQLQPKSLLELSLMSGGVLEWVRSPDGGLGGTGKPRRSHPFHDPLRDTPLPPTSFGRRSKQFGFRLLRSA